MVKAKRLYTKLNQVEKTDLVYFIYFLRNIRSAQRLWCPDIPNLSITTIKSSVS